MGKFYSKAKIIFLEPRVEVGYKGNLLTFFIPVINEELTSWLTEVCERRWIRISEVEVRFYHNRKFLTNAIWWRPDGKVIQPNSIPEKLPLISLRAEIDKPREEGIISIEGTDVSTASQISILKIPPEADIIAEVIVKSPSLKKPVMSKWNIIIALDSFSPIGVKRLD